MVPHVELALVVIPRPSLSSTPSPSGSFFEIPIRCPAVCVTIRSTNRSSQPKILPRTSRISASGRLRTCSVGLKSDKPVALQACPAFMDLLEERLLGYSSKSYHELHRELNVETFVMLIFFARFHCSDA